MKGWIALIFCVITLGAQAADKMGIRGNRYCEVIVSKALTQFSVYNTFGLNDCPPKQWERVTEACVKQETGKSLVHLNGPRYWVIDGFQHSHLVNATPKKICGLEMREAGVLKLGLIDLLKAKQPYREKQVSRHTTWVYEAGKPVYELIDPKGRVFVMQSYSVQKHAQTQKSLSKLRDDLILPRGWTFKTGLLKKRSLLPAIRDLATVVQDDFANTYQLATHDFL